VKSFDAYHFPEDSSRFANLTKQISSLTHPSIVKIQKFTILRNDIRPVVASDYVKSASMENIIQILRLDHTCITQGDHHCRSRIRPWNGFSSQLWHHPQASEAVRLARRSERLPQGRVFRDDENGGIEAN
jgi:hypothetical protein